MRDPEPVLVGDTPRDADRMLSPCAVPLGGGRVRLFYMGDGPGRSHRRAKGAILSALSEDGGLSFVKEPGVRIDVHAPDADRRVLCPDVVPLVDGGFRMYFEARGEGPACIVSATSRDGLSFSREPGVRLAASGEWVGTPKLAATRDGRIRLFAHRHREPDPGGEIARFAIESASSDDGLRFEWESGVRLDRDDPPRDRYAVDCPDVWSLPEGGATMIFSAWDSPRTGALYRACSADGLHWERGEALLPPFEAPCFESEPSLLTLPDGRMRVFFERGLSDGTTVIASATSR